jgi:inorganic pyrophosphatase
MKLIKNTILTSILIYVTSCNIGTNLLTHDSTKTTEGLINVVIEIPAGTTAKWEVTKPDGKLTWQYEDGKPRVVNYLPYPFNYGMIPQTLLSKDSGGDGDPLDAIVIGDSIKRGKVISGKAIGVLKMLDRGEQDDKIIIISQTSPLYFIDDINELDQEFKGITEIAKIWFENYKGKNKIKIQGIGDKSEAAIILEKAIIHNNYLSK